MAKFDYQRRAEADRTRRNGTDRINDFGLPGGLTPPRKRESKSDMRADLERLMAEHAANTKPAARGERRASRTVHQQK